MVELLFQKADNFPLMRNTEFSWCFEKDGQMGVAAQTLRYNSKLFWSSFCNYLAVVGVEVNLKYIYHFLLLVAIIGQNSEGLGTGLCPDEVGGLVGRSKGS